MIKVLQGDICGEIQIAVRDVVVIVMRSPALLPDLAILVVLESVQRHVFDGAMVLIMLVRLSCDSPTTQSLRRLSVT